MYMTKTKQQYRKKNKLHTKKKWITHNTHNIHT